jgi:predicted dehydrogenase
MARRKTRRDFLKTSALAGAGFWIAGTAAADDKKNPIETVRFASIGVGGKGGSDTADANHSGTLIAICDVDEDRLGAAAKKYPNAKPYTDYRQMLDEMGKSIDAVTVSTPDHSHAPASAMAMRLGKHCFTQKPLTHTLFEARRLGEIAREMKVMTQMGNQGTAGAGLRKDAAQVRAGVLGMVKEVHVWTNRPIWPQGGDRPAPADPPANLKWDLWLGPMAERPYGKGYHPFAWRGFWDFGTGALGDMACHTMNMPFMALDLRDPIAVEAESSGHNKVMYPKWSVIKYWFPARGDRPALTLTWYDGGKLPAKDLLGGMEPARSGSLIIGEKGSLYSPGDNGGGGKFLGNRQMAEVAVESSPGHFTEFVRAIKTGKQAMSNFPDYAGPLTETVLLGNLAVCAGKKVAWDAKNLKATNAPEVEVLIRPEYRKGWTL